MTNKNSKIFFIFNLCFCFLIFNFLFFQRVNAEGTNVSLTPLIKEIIVNPGETIFGTVDVANNSSEKIVKTLYPLARDFTSSEDANDSAPKFFESTPDDYTFALAKWIAFDKTEYKIGPKETVNIKYTISVPQNAEAGGHYAAVFASTSSPNVSGQNAVAISSRAGSLLLVTVNGEIAENGTIESFSPTKKIYTKTPAVLKAAIRNSGNVHFKPTGAITISGIGIGKTNETLTFNDNKGNILPQSSRIFENQTGNLGWGRFKADLSIQLAKNEASSTAVAIFWIIPIIPILIILGVIMVIIAAFKLWLKRHDKEIADDK